MGDGYQGTTTPYKVEGGKLITYVSQDPYAYTFYKLGDKYYGARSNEFGYANYEMIPTPLYVANPITALLNQYSIELGLTAEQKQQIIPIVKSELPKLQELKKNTSMKPMEKLEQLKQISDDLDGKITPLLNQEQLKKFQQIREEHRRALVEKLANKAMQKAEADVRGVF
jgi:glycine cleavage system H lipoate-binding protein